MTTIATAISFSSARVSRFESSLVALTAADARASRADRT